MVHPKTIEEYERLGIKEQYDETAHDRALKDKREITKHDKNPKIQITDVYRVRIADDQGAQSEYIIWQQDVTAKTDIDNYHRWHEDAHDTSIYYTPMVEKSIRLNPETEQQETFTNQVLGIETHYQYPFNKENIDMLKKRVNLATRYMVKDVSGFTRSVNTFADWSTKPFDELIAGQRQSQTVAASR
jgi:hypothetical protein